MLLIGWMICCCLKLQQAGGRWNEEHMLEWIILVFPSLSSLPPGFCLHPDRYSHVPGSKFCIVPACFLNACYSGAKCDPSERSARLHAGQLLSSPQQQQIQTSSTVMDRQTILFVIMANLLAGGMMYQRLDKMGYLAPVKEQVAAVVEPVLEALGLFHASYQQCGLQDSTMFVLTSSRVVHPDGVRPGASEC